MSTKAIIPVAGAGTRLRPHTYTQPKPLIPVAGKPILGSIIEQLVAVGVEEFVLIIGYLGDKIKDYVEQNYPQHRVHFVYQEERLGLGHALWTARSVFQHCPEVLIVLGDSIFDADLKKLLANPHSWLGVKRVENPSEFGVVEIDEQGWVKHLIEKPRIPKSNLAIIGLYLIKEVPALNRALQYLIDHNLKTRDEFQLTDALNYMCQELNCRLAAEKVETWFDCGKKDVLLETNAMLLRRPGYASLEQPKHFQNSIIIPPVFLGQHCQIENSVIGPNVSIGDHAQLSNVLVRQSIVGHYASLRDIVLEGSVIGNDTAVRGHAQSLNLGDNTEIDLS